MPFIISRVNIAVTDEQKERIKAALGKAIELVPGKSEEYLMIIFEIILTSGYEAITLRLLHILKLKFSAMKIIVVIMLFQRK